MACNNSLDVLREAVDDDRSVVIVNRVSGGFLYNSGDLQLGWKETDLVSLDGRVRNHDHSYLWRFHAEHVDGERVYRIQAHPDRERSRKYITIHIHADDLSQNGIKWEEWRDDDEDKDEIDAQRWHIVETCEGGIAIVPHYRYGRSYVLGLWQRLVTNHGCVRPQRIFYDGYIPIACTWEILREREVDLVDASVKGGAGDDG